MNYTSAMQFEWDEVKSNECFRERGFDFALREIRHYENSARNH